MVQDPGLSKRLDASDERIQDHAKKRLRTEVAPPGLEGSASSSSMAVDQSTPQVATPMLPASGSSSSKDGSRQPAAPQSPEDNQSNQRQTAAVQAGSAKRQFDEEARMVVDTPSADAMMEELSCAFDLPEELLDATLDIVERAEKERDKENLGDREAQDKYLEKCGLTCPERRAIERDLMALGGGMPELAVTHVAEVFSPLRVTKHGKAFWAKPGSGH